MNALDNFNDGGRREGSVAKKSALDEGWLISGRTYTAIAFQIAVTGQQLLENRAAPAWRRLANGRSGSLSATCHH
ncbi:hypothetical protein WH297_17610 [Ochrobactrum vermis]|uniref:Uncharacterized protein n=1 Tax=Ochrobactrum vermis TaxID=1827297 RepID=A0ABU8PH10_9HYPH|nr:hypothetical protein [Ochrobactrum vermis]